MARSEKRAATRGKASSATTSAATPTVMATPVMLAGSPRSRTKSPKSRWNGAVAPQCREKTARSARKGPSRSSPAISRKRGGWEGTGGMGRRRATSA